MGLLDLILGENNPVASWADNNSNALGNLGAGIAQGGFKNGFGLAAQGAGNARQADEARNKTRQWLLKNGWQDLMPLVDAGQIGAAYAVGTKRLEQQNEAPKTDFTTMQGPDGNVYRWDQSDPKAQPTMFLGGAKPKGADPFAGSGMDAQVANILLTGDPSSPTYAYAYGMATEPKMTMQQTEQGMVPVWSTPQLPPSVRKPTYASSGTPAASPAMSGPPAVPPATGGITGAPGTAVGGVSVGQPLPGTRKPPTEVQARNGAIGKIVLNEIPTVHENFAALSDPKGQLLGVLGAAGNPWQSSEYQQAANGLRSTISSVLYSLSGATANPSEVINQITILTPQFGDKPEVIADKLRRFDTYVSSIAAESGDPDLIAAVQQAIGAASATSSAPAAAPIDMGGGVTIQPM